MHEAVLAMGCAVSGNITEGWAGTSCQRSLACRGERTRIAEKLGHGDGGAVNAPRQWQTNRQPCQHDEDRMAWFVMGGGGLPPLARSPSFFFFFPSSFFSFFLFFFFFC